MARRKPLVVAIKAQVDGAILGIKKMASEVTGFVGAAQNAEDALERFGPITKEQAETAKKALASLKVKQDHVADAQIARIEEQKATLKSLRKAGAITASEYARGWKVAEARIASINKSIGRDTRTVHQKIRAQMKKTGKAMRSMGGRISAGATAAAAAGLAAGGAAVSGISEQAFQVKNSAQVAGLSDAAGLKRFQELAFAADTVGFEVDKVGDILKDVNDRVGDFVQTGAGPLADFFEQIGPKVGVTIDSFKGLNSADALQLFVSSLERANVSQADFTFYLESIAGDATRLLPLLKNNGSEMKRLAKIGENTGAFFDPKDLETMAKFRESTSLLKGSFRGLGLALVEAGVVDVIIDMVNGLRSAVDWVKNHVSPQFLKFGAIFGAIVLAIGPLIVAGGLLMALFSALSATAAAVIGVIAGVAVVIAAVGTAIYVWWDDIVGLFTSGIQGVKDAFHEALTSPFTAAIKLAKFLLEYLNPIGWLIKGVENLGYDVPGFGRDLSKKTATAPSQPTGAPVNIQIGDNEYPMLAQQSVISQLEADQNMKRKVRPTNAPRTFR